MSRNEVKISLNRVSVSNADVKFESDNNVRKDFNELFKMGYE